MFVANWVIFPISKNVGCPDRRYQLKTESPEPSENVISFLRKYDTIITSIKQPENYILKGVSDDCRI